MKRIFTFLIVVLSASCIDPYIPNLKNYNSLLVVEGLITNEARSNIIKLCRTSEKEGSVPEMVTDADVYITDGEGIKTDLQNYRNGYYKTDSNSFQGTIGKRYTLHILTNDGTEYKSDECTMLPVAGIDKLFYVKGEEKIGNLDEFYTGLKILLSSTEVSGINQYLRWTYDEVWKSVIPYPPQNKFKCINDSTFYFEQIPIIKTFCWEMVQSKEIVINSIVSSEKNYFDGQEILFIAPVKSNRLVKQYCLTVKQYSISKEEYDFWDNLKKTGEAGGDIFASQPYMVLSNIHNVKGSGERVLGYFEVSAVSQKRICITGKELEPLNLPNYKTECSQIMKSPDDYPQPDPKAPWNGPFPPDWNAIYHIFTDHGEYEFLRPEVSDGVLLAGNINKKNLVKLVFSLKVCTKCDESGNGTKPDFWVDPE